MHRRSGQPHFDQHAVAILWLEEGYVERHVDDQLALAAEQIRVHRPRPEAFADGHLGRREAGPIVVVPLDLDDGARVGKCLRRPSDYPRPVN